MSESSKRARDLRRVLLSTSTLRALKEVLRRAEYLAGPFPELDRVKGFVEHLDTRNARAIDLERAA